MITLITCASLSFSLIMIETFAYDNLLCNHVNVYSKSENFFLILYAFFEMTPSIIIPYVFYYIPSVKLYKQ